MNSIEIRPSQAAQWLDCSEKAAYLSAHPIHSEVNAEPVALTLGNMVHHILTGHQYKAPDNIRYDKSTRNQRELEMQVERISGAILQIFSQAGLEVEDTEIEIPQRRIWFGDSSSEVLIGGTIDYLIYDKEKKEHYLVDLKTGQQFPSGAWTQVALYVFLTERPFDNDEMIQKGGIIFAPRSKTGVQKIEFMTRPRKPLVALASAIIRQFGYLAQDGPFPNPSTIRCASCPNDVCRFNPISREGFEKSF